MKKSEDKLRPEYSLRELKLVARGPGHDARDMVKLDPDVREAFPTAEKVNEALRSILKSRRKARQA